MIDFIRNHLKEIVIFSPIVAILAILGLVQYLDMIYEAMVKEEASEYPKSISCSQEEHAQALADDPNVESEDK